jgi:ATP-dependent exoDNAse (exonuclease V) alpha subunit
MAVADDERIAVKASLLAKDDPLRQAYMQKTLEYSNLEKTGNVNGVKSLIVVDETSLTGIKDADTILNYGRQTGAKVAFQGDIKQLSSVAAGATMRLLLDSGAKVSEIRETRRFISEDVKKAVDLMSKRNDYVAAISSLPIIESKDVLNKTVDRYFSLREQLIGQGIEHPEVGIITARNTDRKLLNTELTSALHAKGMLHGEGLIKEHLDRVDLSKAEKRFAGLIGESGATHLVFNKSYDFMGLDKGFAAEIKGYDVVKNLVTVVNKDGLTVQIDPKAIDLFEPRKMESRTYYEGQKVESRSPIHFGRNESDIKNGTRGVITGIDAEGVTVKWTGQNSKDWATARETRLSNEQVRNIEHGYAHTSMKEQGVTTDGTITAVPKESMSLMSKAMFYVNTTRARRAVEYVVSNKNDLLDAAKKAQESDLGIKRTATSIEKVEKNQNRVSVIFADLMKRTELTRPKSSARDATVAAVNDKGQQLTPTPTPAKANEQSKTAERAPERNASPGRDIGRGR